MAPKSAAAAASATGCLAASTLGPLLGRLGGVRVRDATKNLWIGRPECGGPQWGRQLVDGGLGRRPVKGAAPLAGSDNTETLVSVWILKFNCSRQCGADNIEGPASLAGDNVSLQRAASIVVVVVVVVAYVLASRWAAGGAHRPRPQQLTMD